MASELFHRNQLKNSFWLKSRHAHSLVEEIPNYDLTDIDKTAAMIVDQIRDHGFGSDEELKQFLVEKLQKTLSSTDAAEVEELRDFIYEMF
ncbi:MAG: hypothetical protein RIF33_07540 [Cyclobacteriaceae bacterium]